MSEHVSALIRCEDVVRAYDDGRITALDGVSLSIGRGEFVAVRGPSGCGKSTLMQLIGYLESPDSGRLLWDGVPYTSLDAEAFRASNVGFVFQLHNLLPTLTARQNVEIPMFETGRSRAARRERAMELIERMRREQDLTVVLVTHDERIAERADRQLHMLDGRIRP